MTPPAQHPKLDLHQALHGNVRRMHHIQRYSSLPVLRRENVAEHSWQVAFICLLVGEDLRAQGHVVDMAALLARAVCHDTSETMSGDIIRSFKYSTPEVAAAMRDADDRNTYALSRQFGRTGDAVYTYWREAKDTSLEGAIVALADLVCVVTYCAEEKRLGNSELDHVLEHAHQTIVDKFGTTGFLGQYVHQLFPNGKWDDPYDQAGRLALQEYEHHHENNTTRSES